jgi:hypothetical protein
MDYSSGRAHGCRLTQYFHRSLTHLALENDLLRVTLLADKGADIIEFRHKITDTDFLWKERSGIRQPALMVSTIPSSLGNNLDWYEGGWHECLPGGGPAVIHGAQQGLHGEAALLPWGWIVEEDEPDCIRVLLTCRLVRLPLVVRKRLTMKAGSAVLRIEETLENESDVPLQFLWGHHPTFGAPFLDEDCRIDIPARTFRAEPGFTAPKMFFDAGTAGGWPSASDREGREIDLSRIPPPGTGTAGLLCIDVDEGWYAITNTRARVGFGLQWDAALFPCLYYWHVFNGIPDYPWFATAYVIGLEPWTSFPMNHDAARAAGTALQLPGGGRVSTAITAVAYAGRDRVSRVSPDGTVQ